MTAKRHANLTKLRKRIAASPEQPGVYRFLGKDGVLYVGKAKDLRKRLQTYVQKGQKLGPWKELLVQQAVSVETTVTNSELEALILETNLIKKFRPKFNVLMKDDKNYVYIKVTTSDPFPRIDVVRRMVEDGSTYIGPKTSADAVQKMLRFVRTIFPLRTCRMSIDPAARGSTFHVPRSTSGAADRVTSNESTRNEQGIPIEVMCTHKDRPTPCLDHHIKRCFAPCIGVVSPEQYGRTVEEFLKFLRGDTGDVEQRMKVEIQRLAQERKFEQAAKLRDQLQAMLHIQEKQFVSDTSGANEDILGIASSAGTHVVVVLRERDGKVIGEESFTLSGQASPGEALLAFLTQHYGEASDVPEVIVVPPFETPSTCHAEERAQRASRSIAKPCWAPQGDTLELEQELTTISQWLTQKRGKKVSILTPKRGKKSKLLELAMRNAKEKVKAQEAVWESEARKVKAALDGLKKLLRLSSPLRRIECYDISHLGGTETVGSMVVFVDGKPRHDHYRSFALRTVKSGEVDDYKALKEVLMRRLRYLRKLESEWKERGVTFRKARKAEQKAIESIVRSQSALSDESLRYKDFVVARKGREIVALARLIQNPGDIREMKSLWVADAERGNKLGHAVIGRILKGVKKGKVYIILDPSHRLEEYYAQIGFQRVQQAPKVLQEKTEKFHQEHPDHPIGTIMMYNIAEHRNDPSLTTPPDLLLLDGGKGQLGVGVEALKEGGLVIPLLAIAKKHEEVFFSPPLSSSEAEGRSERHEDESRGTSASRRPAPARRGWALEESEIQGPLNFSRHEESKYLLMRLRDEAHRFANELREGRHKRARTGSALDEIPGIGPALKRSLLKKFGTVVGVKQASDAELLEVLPKTTLRELRQHL